MATLGKLEKADGLNRAATEAANFYSEGIKEWKKTSMNNGVKNASDIIQKFVQRPVQNTHAEVTLQDANKY